MTPGAAAGAIVQWLSDDGVTAMALVIGVPACGFLFACSATLWRMAERQQVRLWRPPCLLAVAAGFAIYLCWPFIADQLAFIAARTASPGSITATTDSTYGQVAVLWPAGWSLLGGIVLLGGSGSLGRSARGVLAALVAGNLAGLLTIVVVINLGFLMPSWLRIPYFLTCLAGNVAILAIAPRQDRAWGLHRAVNRTP